MIALVCGLGVVAMAVLVFLGIRLFAAPRTDAQAFAQAYTALMESAEYGNDSVPAMSSVATPAPTSAPTEAPTLAPTEAPTEAPAPAPTEAPQQDVFAGGFEMDIEGYLSETWWGSAGSSIDNPDATATAPGYPKVYNLAEGENQYIFHTDTQTVQLLFQETDGSLTDMGEYDYAIDPYGFYLYSFYRTFAIDGVDHEIYSAFFVCDDVLYEVEMMDGCEVSNYIAYTIYGP
jgi:hypothetical protein